MTTTVEVGGVPISLLDAAATRQRVAAAVADPDGCLIVNHLAAHPTVLARRDPGLRRVLQRAHVNVADGRGVVWAARLLSGGDRPRDRVYGPDAMLDTIAEGVPQGWRHAFVGGTDERLALLLERLRARFPDMRVAGSVAPPFREVTEAAVAEDLAALGGDADVLWVGLGVPKQLLWADLAARHRPARVLATVGAAFDLHAGVLPQAPAWMQRAGLEWAYRLGREPRRLAGRYLIGNGLHVAGVAGDWWRLRGAGAEAAEHG